MKYDFFKNVDQTYGLDCAPLYSKMFQGVKFIPKTYFIVNESKDKDGNKKGYICVDVKDPNNKGNIIKLYLTVFNHGTNSYHVRDIYFTYNNGYEFFVISNIHVVDSGFEYKYECYNSYKQIAACEHRMSRMPRPEYFKELNIEPDIESIENIPDYFTKDVISHITQDYYLSKSSEEIKPKAKTRLQGAR